MSEQVIPHVPRIPTGVPGLDDVLAGGFIRRMRSTSPCVRSRRPRIQVAGISSAVPRTRVSIAATVRASDWSGVRSSCDAIAKNAWRRRSSSLSPPAAARGGELAQEGVALPR